MSPSTKALLGGEPEPVVDEPKKRGPGRPPKSSKRDELNGKIRESLAEVAKWIAERDPELGEILAQDGPKMADLLARLATHPKTPDPVSVLVGLLATILEPVRAFGRTARVLVLRAVDRRRARLELEPLEPAAPGEVFPEPVYAESENELAARDAAGTPDRFRVDYDPERDDGA